MDYSSHKQFSLNINIFDIKDLFDICKTFQNKTYISITIF